MLVQINQLRVNLASFDIIVPKFFIYSTFFSDVYEEPTDTILEHIFISTIICR